MEHVRALTNLSLLLSSEGLLQIFLLYYVYEGYHKFFFTIESQMTLANLSLKNRSCEFESHLIHLNFILRLVGSQFDPFKFRVEFCCLSF
jgi:hypothetical protein